ncbi:ABC transporter permease [Streptococcus caprae]|uniref:Putative hemin transport system permease protein HrtB n=1 Tax=Streptococcus caprae TaxID=1640501 RepID=A0ABV8CWV3_9STRE
MGQVWAEVRFHWKKYLLIELLIVLMMYMVVFLTGLAGGLAEQSSGVLEAMPAEAFVLSEDAKGLLADSSISQDQKQQVEEELDRETIPFSVERSAMAPKDSEDKLDVVYLAVEADSELVPEILSGSGLKATENGVLLSQSFEEEGLEVGDVVKDRKSELELKVVGFVPSQSYTFAPVAYITAETLTAMKTAQNPAYQESVQALALLEKPGQVTIKDLSLLSRGDLIGNVPGYTAQQLTINLISIVLLVVSAAILGIFFYIISLQKRQQFGIMRAVGLSSGEIIGQQFLQGFFLALVGVLMGNGLALLTMSLLPDKVPVAVDLTSSIIASASFVGMAILSILISCLQILKIDPVKIIGGGEA